MIFQKIICLAFFLVYFEYGQGIDYVMINILELDDSESMPNCTDDPPSTPPPPPPPPEPPIFSFFLPSTETDANETLPTTPNVGGSGDNTTDWPLLDQLKTVPNTNNQTGDPPMLPPTPPETASPTSNTESATNLPTEDCISPYTPRGHCKRVINITWLPTPPFMFQYKNASDHVMNENADLKGVFYNIIGRAAKFCCKHFDREGTRFQYTHKALNKSMMHGNIFHGDANIGLPVYIENELFELHYAGSLKFIKVLESPGLVLIADKNSATERSKQVMWRAIANEWPVMLISLLLCAISGICVWALVSQAFVFPFSLRVKTLLMRPNGSLCSYSTITFTLESGMEVIFFR